MIHDLISSLIHCPYCGEAFEIIVDHSAGDQNYIEDCQICCAPIEIGVEVGPDGELLNLLTKRDTD